VTEPSSSAPLPIDDFDYDLPPELIAQTPLEVRSESRLMVLDRVTGAVSHDRFSRLPDLLEPGDLLVFNDTRVIPARLLGNRKSGGKVEFLLLRRESQDHWVALAKPAGKLRLGEYIHLSARDGEPGHRAGATVVEKLGDGQVRIELDTTLEEHLAEFGRVPLPPYITHQLDDDERYQTVYARLDGSAAAPTAGLHFTQETMQVLAGRGIDTAFVTLHVGLDTFRPVLEDDARKHQIHREWCSMSQDCIDRIAAAKANGSRVIAVGTTTARTLETYGQRLADGQTGPFASDTGIYITPGYRWSVVDALFTNFHLPKSTLLLMVSALAGRERILAAYQEAVRERYRFFSFGDAMLIL
jgi:S-adenosylmethionine:tRNA ribosyltransferase-isomerase